MIAISQTVSDRILKYYQRHAHVIYPPFDESYWKNIKEELISQPPPNPYYLIVSRLEQYKKIDLAINVFKVFKDKKLIIVGTGSQEQALKKMAGNNIQFLKDLSDKELALYYAGAQALIMPQEEDFGYVALEAQYFDCPVIAYRKGGALETVIENKTGIFFKEQTELSLGQALESYEKMSYNLKQSLKDTFKSQVRQFSVENFEKQFIKNL
jgi:glycosyltransferase involved in cell wall biosynthesis